MKKLWELYASFFRIGILTIGGGLAMLPMLKREVVDKYHWINEEEMMDIYAIGQCTPGIIAVNTATYIGYLEAGIRITVCAAIFGLMQVPKIKTWHPLIWISAGAVLGILFKL